MIYNPTPIDEHLKLDLLVYDSNLKAIQSAGFLRQVIDPSSRKAILACEQADPSEPLRAFTIDTVNYDVQLGHLLNGGTSIPAEKRWGSRTETSFNLQLTLLVATTRPDLFGIILHSLSGVQDLHVTEFFANSLAVLQREFLFTPTSSNPYDPKLCAYAVRYTQVNSELNRLG